VSWRGGDLSPEFSLNEIEGLEIGSAIPLWSFASFRMTVRVRLLPPM